MTDLTRATVRDIVVELTRVQGEPGTGGEAEHYRPYAFFQLIQDRNNTAAYDVEFWMKPWDVRDIRAPTFEDLPAESRRILGSAQMIAFKPEDQDLIGLAGANLYRERSAPEGLFPEPDQEGIASGHDARLPARHRRPYGLPPGARVDNRLPERLRKRPVFKLAPKRCMNRCPDT
jgi:hypothetical protein